MAFKISSVLGFIVCPPSTTTSTPMSLKIELSPAPALTLITPIFFLSFLFSFCELRILSTSFITLSLCSSRILSIFRFVSSPNSSPFCIANPGSFVCTWILTTSSSDTHTNESPIDVRYFFKPSSSTGVNSLFRLTINSVQYPNLISEVSMSSTDTPALLSIFEDIITSPSSITLPFNPSSIPCIITIRPCPPESTTPAFFSTGNISGVWASTLSPWAIISSKKEIISSNSSWISSAFSPIALATVSIVPSLGFITAL